MKALLAGVLLLVFGMGAFAQKCPAKTAKKGTCPKTQQVQPAPKENWEALQLGFWFGYPESTENSNVSGVKLGLPVCSGKGKVYGLEWSLFCSATDTLRGFQWSIGCCMTKDLDGAQMSLVNIAEPDDMHGAQIGLFNKCKNKGFQIGLINMGNNATMQLGLLNFQKDGWMPFMIIFNIQK
jgi:hypothetical protein